MTDLLRGLRQAIDADPAQFSRPIVVPVLSDFTSEAAADGFAQAVREAGVSTIRIADEAAPAKLERVRPGEIVVLRVGRLPPRAFERIFARATLPALVEGKNLSSFLLARGQPFLNARGTTEDIIADSGGESAAETLPPVVREGFRALARYEDRELGRWPPDPEAIARFYLQARPGGTVSDFFASFRRDPASLDHDLVARALWELLHHLGRTQEASGSSLTPASVVCQRALVP